MRLSAAGVILAIVGLVSGFAGGRALEQDSRASAWLAIGGLIVGAVIGSLIWRPRKRD